MYFSYMEVSGSRGDNEEFERSEGGSVCGPATLRRLRRDDLELAGYSLFGSVG